MSRPVNPRALLLHLPSLMVPNTSPPEIKRRRYLDVSIFTIAIINRINAINIVDTEMFACYKSLQFSQVQKIANIYGCENS